jgi:DNA-binding CsgD family transcriptional regulator
MQLTYGIWRANANPNRREGGLAPREAQHLMALASGLSQKQIAREFGVSVSTVRHSVRRIYDRLGVDRSTAAVAQAVRRGWIAPLLVALIVGAMNPGSDALRVRQPLRTRQQVSSSSRISRRDTGSEYA